MNSFKHKKKKVKSTQELSTPGTFVIYLLVCHEQFTVNQYAFFEKNWEAPG